MKNFNMKYIFSSLLSLYILSLLIVSLLSSIHINLGYILRESLVTFWIWCIYLAFFTFLITSVWGIIQKIRYKSPKKSFIISFSALGIAIVLFISLGMASEIFENHISSSNVK
ncbi:hypothetical protein CN403_26360 [Bacillus cereus]|nr:hypothetical protein CN403_26360 [Bacillus cereus]